jgi:hypothetical protein
MPNRKLYFATQEGQDLSDIESCRTKESWITEMKELGIDKLSLYSAKREVNSPAFYCQENESLLGKHQGYCGKGNCGDYSPRNGKSGICKHYRNPYELADEPELIRPLYMSRAFLTEIYTVL